MSENETTSAELSAEDLADISTAIRNYLDGEMRAPSFHATSLTVWLTPTLARIVAEREAAAKAAALREAADDLVAMLAGHTRETPQTRAGRDILARLRDRADRIEAQR